MRTHELTEAIGSILYLDLGIPGSYTAAEKFIAGMRKSGYQIELVPIPKPTERAMIMVESDSKPGTFYKVSTMSDGTTTCTCISGKIRGYCKHQRKAVKV